MCGARDMAFPYVNMLSYWAFVVAVVVLLASFFVPGGPTGAGWTLYPPQAITAGTPGSDMGIILMLISLILFVAGFTMGGLNYIITVLQLRARGMTLMRLPLTIWGIFTATVLAMFAFPALLVGCLMMTLDSLLGTSFFMPAMVSLGETLTHEGGSPNFIPTLVLVFWSPRSLYRCITGFWNCFRFTFSAFKKNYFWLQNDGLGYCWNWCFKLFCLGSPHVRKWNEPLVWFLFCYNNTNYCSSYSYKSLQLDFNIMERKHSIISSNVIFSWLYSYFFKWWIDWTYF